MMTVQNIDRIFSTPNLLLIDVRSREDFDRAHFEDAVNVPMYPPPWESGEILSFEHRLRTIAGLNKNRPIAVYCTFGKRSSLAKELLGNNGYANVVNLGGVEESPLKDYIHNRS